MTVGSIFWVVFQFSFRGIFLEKLIGIDLTRRVLFGMVINMDDIFYETRRFMLAAGAIYDQRIAEVFAGAEFFELRRGSALTLAEYSSRQSILERRRGRATGG